MVAGQTCGNHGGYLQPFKGSGRLPTRFPEVGADIGARKEGSEPGGPAGADPGALHPKPGVLSEMALGAFDHFCCYNNVGTIPT